MEGGANLGRACWPHRPANSPWCPVQQRSVVCLEHPFIIKDVDRGLNTFGGDKRIEKMVNTEDTNYAVEIYLRPGDPMCRPLVSHNVKTNNVLFKIVAPKRTGRKRKRGSLEPFEMPPRTTESNSYDPNPPPVSSVASESGPPGSSKTGYMLRSMRDNVGRYRIDAIGTISRTHRFRELSDFQYSTVDSTFMNKMRTSVLTYDYEKMKEFKLDPSQGVKENTDLIPPPFFSSSRAPFNYNYKQNPGVRYMLDNHGQPMVVNDRAAPRIMTHMVAANIDKVPAQPPDDLPDITTLEPLYRDTISKIHELMDKRPLWTRRALLNCFTGQDFQYTMKTAVPYVGYMFRSGPWRDTIVKFGVDPRSDPIYRIYQTVSFQIYDGHEEVIRRRWQDDRTKYQRTVKGKKPNLQSHIFDGRHVEVDGKVWQVCDVTDPLVKSLLENSTCLRTKCDKWDGWFPNGRWAKVKTIMRAKIRSIREGKIPSDLEFTEILKLPDEFDESSREQAQISATALHKDIELGSQLRAMIAQRGGGAYQDPAKLGRDIIGNAHAGSICDTARGAPDAEHGGNEHLKDTWVAEMMLELNRAGRDDDSSEDGEEGDYDEGEEDDGEGEDFGVVVEEDHDCDLDSVI